MKGNTQVGYSKVQKNRFLKQFRQIMRTIEPLLKEKFGSVDSIQFRETCIDYYADRILPDLPYIGGTANPMTSFLIQTSAAAALYQQLSAKGLNLEESAEIIYRGMVKMVAEMPRLFLRFYGWWENSSLRYPAWKKAAQRSKERAYPFDWVFSYVDGHGQPYDFGIDIFECGIKKYLEEQQCSELTPYLCYVDYITNAAMGVELRRTQTLAFGCEKCDFRFKKNGQPLRPEWPPDFPEKNCGQGK